MSAAEISRTKRLAAPDRSAPAHEPLRPADRAAVVTGRAVLIVDDDPSIGALLSHVFARVHWQATCESGALDALDLVRSGRRFDLAVIDQQMPALSGVELAKKIKELQSDIRLILISGQDRPNDTLLHGAGIDVFISKPLDVNEILFTGQLLTD